MGWISAALGPESSCCSEVLVLCASISECNDRDKNRKLRWLFLQGGALLHPGCVVAPGVQIQAQTAYWSTHSLTLWSGCKYGVRFYSQIATLQQWDHTAVIIKIIVMESSATEYLTAKSVSFTSDLIFLCFSKRNEHNIKLWLLEHNIKK